MYRSKAGALSILAASVFIPAGTRAAPPPSHTELVARTVRFGHVQPHAVVSVRPEVGVALLQRGERGADGIVWGVELQSEVMDEAVAESYGWRSMRWRLDLDCQARSSHVGQTEAFPDHALAGASHPGPLPDGWVKPTPGAFMGDVIKAVCGPARPGKPAPPAPAIVAQAAPAPVRIAPAPGASPSPPPPPAIPRVVAPAGSFTVQIGAFLSAADADAAASALAARSDSPTPPPTAQIENARVRGRLYHRVLVRGFASPSDAEAYCASAHTHGGACFVRGR